MFQPVGNNDLFAHVDEIISLFGAYLGPVGGVASSQAAGGLGGTVSLPNGGQGRSPGKF